MSDDYNMSMRKFLKQVGVTSQQAIDDAMREAGPEVTAGKSYRATMTLKIEELGLEHRVDGRIVGRDDDPA